MYAIRFQSEVAILSTRLPIYVLFLLLLTFPLLSQDRSGSIDGGPTVTGRIDSTSTGGAFQIGRTKQSNIGMFVTNWGILGHDVNKSRAGLVWGSGTGGSYLFGGGFWFGARKRVPGEDTARTFVVMSFDPMTLNSDFAPGRATSPTQHEPVDTSITGRNWNRLYKEYDYDRTTGRSILDPEISPLWPNWTDPQRLQTGAPMLGEFLPDENARSAALSSGMAPAITTDDHFFSLFRDNDLDRYDTTRDAIESAGYPLGLEVQSYVFGWVNGRLADAILVIYRVVNRSTDTLHDCYFAPVFDPDVGDSQNDYVSTVNSDPENDSVEMVQAWSHFTSGDVGRGYIGFDLVGTPSVDSTGMIRVDRTFHPPDQQIGLHAVRLRISTGGDNPFVSPTREGWYDYIADPGYDADTRAGEVGVVLTTGPFTMTAGDTANFAVAILLASAETSSPDGTDNASLLSLSAELQNGFNSLWQGTNGVREGEDLIQAIRRLNLR